jgi:hypothetical protein
LGFDGDSSFPLDVHRVQDLVSKIPVFYKTRILDQTVGQGGLPMVNMGYDAKVSYIGHKDVTQVKMLYRIVRHYNKMHGFYKSTSNSGTDFPLGDFRS